ncbi:F13A1 [Cordylochernes scorpioides]|uniref:F13A1 n=1 Tax=Cordylochernes scorpioides TaxID=51811 RepID=A0ABY6L535_9ARAC|nr:F13A1 [Cordylochernes scorpioides]
MIENFHVWNDCWMARPDLPVGYGGWQTVDSTPQETSEGIYRVGPTPVLAVYRYLTCIYRVGPTPVLAVRRGEIGLQYDCQFVFAEVNADIVHWRVGDDRRPEKLSTNKYHVGRSLLTKRVGIMDDRGERDAENITDLYKDREGSAEERMAVLNAARLGGVASIFELPAPGTEDVRFDLVDIEKVMIGKPFRVAVRVTNLAARESRSVTAAISASSVYYTGVVAQRIARDTASFVLYPRQEELLSVTVQPEQYLDKLVEYSMVKVYALATVRETRQTWAEEDDFYVDKPRLDIQVRDRDGVTLKHCSMAYWLKVITALLIIGCIELNPGPKRQATLKNIHHSTPDQATLTNIPHLTPDQAPMDDLKLLIINLSAEVNRLGEKMDARLLNIEQKMEVWERRMTGIETSMASCTDALATNTSLISHNTLKIRNLEERAEALERRARENNLIIYGIESAETDSRELLLQKVKKLMAEDMQITDDVVIAECHRLGRGPKAPILIEVPDHESRISLLKNSFKLRMLNIFMSRDYSPQIREQRKILIEKRKELYKKGIGSKLRDNKLLLNGINYMLEAHQRISVNRCKYSGNKIHTNEDVQSRNKSQLTETPHTSHSKTHTIKESQLKGTNLKHNKIKIKKIKPMVDIAKNERFMYWNINGFFRINSLFPLFEYLKQFEMFALTETWCHFNIDLNLANFGMYQSPAVKSSDKGRGSGGIILGINKQLQPQIDNVEIETSWIAVTLNPSLDNDSPAICVIFVYLPPNDTHATKLGRLFHLMENKIYNGFEIILVGDLNVRIGNLGGYHNLTDTSNLFSTTRNSCDLTKSAKAEIFIDFLDKNHLTIINGRSINDKSGKFTFISGRGSSVLDLAIVSPAVLEHIADFEIGCMPYSDHLPIILKFIGPNNKTENCYMEPKAKIKFSWSVDKIPTYIETLKELTPEHPADSTIDTQAEDFTGLIQTAMLRSGTRMEAKTKNIKSKPCYPKAKKREYTDKIQVILSNVKDPAQFWKTINSLKYRNNLQGEISTADWQVFYRELLGSNLTKVVQLPLEILDIDPELDCEISLTEVTKEISKLGKNKATGLDEIPNEAIKYLLEEHTIYLRNLFNKILGTSQVPQQWTKTIIHPIFKNGDPDNPSNYRGISLISNLSKLFTSILKTRLNDWMERKSILAENQAGFRKGYSCQDHIFTLVSLIQMTLSRRRGKLYAFFIDLRKAFDTVPHHLLWKKLALNGLSCRFIKLIKNYYTQMTATVRWRGSFTEAIKIQAGVLQGEPLSPYLFILFLNDLVPLFDESELPGINLENYGTIHLLLYADDIVILGESKINLQLKINLLKKYLEENCLTLNQNKSKIMVFRNSGRTARSETWFWGQQPLTIVAKYTYLGYPLTTKISTQYASQYFRNKALNAINALWRILTKARIKSFTSVMKLLDTIVLPTLLYAAPMWAINQLKTVNNTQDAFLRRLLDLPNFTPGYVLRRECGRISTELNAVKLTLKFWGCEDYLAIQKELPGIIRTTTDQLIQNDQMKITDSTHFAHYKSLSESFMTEEYLRLNISLPNKRLVAQHRVLWQFFREERKDFWKENGRNCLLCKDLMDDNLVHYFFQCPLLTEKRTEIFPSPTSGQSGYHSMCQLLSSDLNDRLLIDRYVKFCTEAGRMRKNAGQRILEDDPSDTVYMEDEKCRQEYVLNDVGKIYVGTYVSPRGRKWVYGQFEAKVLAACLFLLERSKLDPVARASPVKVVRTVAAMVNSLDDDGVVIGSWSGQYGDGTAPWLWTGSAAILTQYMKSGGEPVKYGQCWVFAGVCTTVLRALGIPCRTVSNFVSAHDTDDTLTIDKYFDKEGEEIMEYNTDSVWNFHVWNDCWMARPDLPVGYGGWQTVDSTPQETSEGIYRVGPTPVLAVRRGEIGLQYDCQFVFAEVNADIVHWRVGDDRRPEKLSTNKYHVGRSLLTKRVGIMDDRGERDAENITDLYKDREGKIRTKQRKSIKLKARTGIKRKFQACEKTIDEKKKDSKQILQKRNQTQKATIEYTNTASAYL